MKIQESEKKDTMDMDTFARQALEAAVLITGTDIKDPETQRVALELGFAMYIQEKNN